MANFANKFYVDEKHIVHAPQNLPLTPIQKAFNDVKGQLQTANSDINNLKSTNSDLVNQVKSIANDNQKLVGDANEAKTNAQQSAKMMSGLVAQVFQLENKVNK